MSQMPTLPSPAALYGSAMQQIQGYGNAEQAALQQNYQNAMGMAQQQLAGSGLAGTSVAPSMRLGYMKQYQLALNNLNQQLTQTKLARNRPSASAASRLGQSQQQISNQMTLGQGNLDVNRGYLGVAQQQAAAQAAAQAGQGTQNQGYNWQPSGDVAGMYANAYAAGSSMFS